MLHTPPIDDSELEKIINSATRYQIEQLPASASRDFVGEKSDLITLCAANVEVKPVTWLWRNVFVQGGLNSIQGIAVIGKIYLLCAVCAAVSNGGDFQSVDGGMEKLKQGRVLYLTGDDDISTTLVPRLNEFNADLNNVHFAAPGILPSVESAQFAHMH